MVTPGAAGDEPHCSRSVVMLEQMAGVMYVALVVARLVGLTIRRDR